MTSPDPADQLDSPEVLEENTDFSHASKLWDKYSPSEIFILPTLVSGRGIEWMLEEIEEGIDAMTETSNLIYAHEIQSRMKARAAKQYLEILEPMSTNNFLILGEIVAKQEPMAEIENKMLHYPVYHSIAGELIKKLELARRLAKSMRRQQKKCRKSNSDYRMTAIAVGMKCIDEVWREISSGVRGLMKIVQEESKKKADFIPTFRFVRSDDGEISVTINDDAFESEWAEDQDTKTKIKGLLRMEEFLDKYSSSLEGRCTPSSEDEGEHCEANEVEADRAPEASSDIGEGKQKLGESGEPSENGNDQKGETGVDSSGIRRGQRED